MEIRYSPKSLPAVIVGVTDNDKILLTKYADREYKRYALIAGFTEIERLSKKQLQGKYLKKQECILRT